MAAWGHHLILDAAGCNENRRDRAAIASFSDALVSAVGMVAFGAPIIEHFGHDDPETSGFTLVQLIETSNITAHFCDNTGEIYLDLFSCKDFDSETAVAVFRRHFAPQRLSVDKFDRKAPALAGSDAA